MVEEASKSSTPARPKGAAKSATKKPAGRPPRREVVKARESTDDAPSRTADVLVPLGLGIALVVAVLVYSKTRNAAPPEPTNIAANPSSEPEPHTPPPTGSGAANPTPPRPSAPTPPPQPAPTARAQDVTVTPTHPDPPPNSDPMHGQFTLQQATAGLPAGPALIADIETSMGTFTCTLMTHEAPNTVANFVGLARGLRDFWDPVAGNWTRRPYYDGTVFHRVIPDFMIQGGDILRSGRGGPGYTINDENTATHDPGMLSMANRGPNTGGSQFFILETQRANLNGSYSTFGRCEPLDLVRRIARVPVAGTTPLTPVTLQHVRIHR